MNYFPHTNFLRGEKFHLMGIIKTCEEQNFHVGLQVFREGFSGVVGGQVLHQFSDVSLCLLKCCSAGGGSADIPLPALVLVCVWHWFQWCSVTTPAVLEE